MSTLGGWASNWLTFYSFWMDEHIGWGKKTWYCNQKTTKAILGYVEYIKYHCGGCSFNKTRKVIIHKSQNNISHVKEQNYKKIYLFIYIWYIILLFLFYVTIFIENESKSYLECSEYNLCKNQFLPPKSNNWTIERFTLKWDNGNEYNLCEILFSASKN